MSPKRSQEGASSQASPQAKSQYDETYYREHLGQIPYERNDYWLRFFHGVADQIVRSFRPRRVLDAGCAKGFLVEALWERGVEAYGIDVSEYAIGEVRKDVRPYCRRASLTEPIEGRFDLITCIEVLEHMEDNDARLAIRNLTGATDTILFSSTPVDLTEPTHVNVRPTISWLNQFADNGFAPDLLFDASFVAPHAFLLRAAERPPEDVLVLFSEMIRYRLILADRHRKLEAAEAQVAALSSQLHPPVVERRDPEREPAPGGTAPGETPRVETERELRSMIAALTEYADSLRTKSDRVELRVGTMESRLAAVRGQTEEILHSRIWRTLCAAGAILLAPRSLFSSRAIDAATARIPDALKARTPGGPDKDFHGLMCDEPQPDGNQPRTGEIRVRGWVLARSGIERIEVSLPGVTVMAETGGVRPDLEYSFPNVPGARNSGFTASINAAAVPGGLQFLRVKAFSRGGALREVRVPVRIDHEAGFASDYDRWIAECESRNGALIELKLAAFAIKPLISILVPVYRTPLDVLRRTIESVVAQSYPNWELCMADDGSKSPAIERLLSEFAAKDRRIRLQFLPANGGIAHASSAALAMAQGEFVALLDHDDELAQDALFHTVEAINRQPEVEFLYSDEDKIDENGRRYDPFFKPGWSPDLLLSENYICHLLVARRALVNQAGGFRGGFDGSQDYDLVLRLTGSTGKIAHIPRVLYHWRSVPGSTASAADRKTYTAGAARRAIQDELDRRGTSAEVVPGSIPGRWRVRYPLAEQPPVSIIIPSGGKTDALRSNLTSLFGKTGYGNYEVVIIDNSTQKEIRKLVETWPDPPRPLRYLDCQNQPFNFAALNNRAARQCQSPVLLFLNDDTTVIAPGWLEALVELAARAEVGAVGARLLYPDGRIQHAGVVMGLFENCGHAFKGLPGDRQHYFDLPDVIRNVSAVTGACLMVRAEVFREVGGFDEQAFAVAFNDIDLCLKIGSKGYRVLYTPHALLCHHEAFSKTAKDLVPHPAEVRAMQEKWKDVIAADPFYSPNLTRTAEDYSLFRAAPRV